MVFCYALISKGTTPVCQHCAVSGNFDLYYQKFLPKDKSKDGIVILKVDGYIWGILSDEDDLNILCVVRESCEKQMLVKILNEIKTVLHRYLKTRPTDWENASTFSLQAAFEPSLRDICRTLDRSPANLAEIVPPSIAELESSDADEYNLLLGNNTPGVRSIGYRARKRKIIKIVAFVAILVIVALIIYLLLAYFCGGFAIPHC
ncbi:hypothetical protein TVAG_166650 [Trichomonas vaginalis G3]|uniref:Longin domain-containing protein n=1 Tax=Trichomonas vaginalis (strain ATCC PRA-98 / G3) TaxID=412133 RepID=A2DE72_TRIV3|nr:SNAP receptor protein [Trichomonas vaginalis G3]EAY21290.1 hypothetical protein TVAG_166650 [Trichomonas vaginalis G3]KAI5548864.1 SNAP receptor protein [Trichomonas vaginalis G3]|eukprot:XP_001582276.1 hypothetical protein [Trichomonas vaginalis G3]